YCRQKKAEKALAVCENAWSSLPPANAAQLCMTALAAMRQDEEVIEQVDAQLARARARHPADAALASASGHLRAVQASASGHLRTVQVRLKEAEAFYAQALKANPKDILAMNNLAWVLAPQKGRAREAVELIDKAIDLTGPRPWLL